MKNRRRISLYLSLIFAAGMLLFTFYNVVWHSDAKGFETGFGNPIGYNSGTRSTVADCVWTAAPFLLLYSTFLFFLGKTERRIGIFLSALPMTLYGILRFPDLLDEKMHFTLAVTMLGMIVIGAFSIAAAFMPEAERMAPVVIFSYLGLEILLLVFSVFYGEKYSFFIFAEDLLIGRTSVFHYTFIVISVFLYYACYALSLGLRMLPPKMASATENLPDKPEDGDKTDDDDDGDEDYSSLTLEDLGIQR